MKHIKLKISKKTGFWRYKVEVELDLQPQPQAPYMKEIIIRGKSSYGATSTRVKGEYDLVTLYIAGSYLYCYEDPSNNTYVGMYNLCSSMYLIKPYQRRVEFYLEYDVNINRIIDVFKDLDYKIDEMVQELGTPAFDYFLNETKYIKLKISKKTGFWRYKVEVELDLQPQPQAPYMKEIIIRGKSSCGATSTRVKGEYDLVTLYIAGSYLYCYEDPSNNTYVGMYNLCSSMYLIKPYQRRVEFYLEYDVNINRIIDVFKDLDYKIDEMVQELGTPAFDYFLNETKYIKLKISKKVGYWRYKVEVELNLQPQPQAPYMKEIIIRGKSSCGATSTKVKEEYDLITLYITGSDLYCYEDPSNNTYVGMYSLCSLMYLIKPYQQRIEFYLEYDVNINRIIDVFKDLDYKIDEIVQELGTPAFDYFLNETKYIKLKISKKAGYWRYKVEVELDLQPQPQAPYIKKIIIRGRDYYKVIETGVKDESDLIALEIADSKLYCCGDLTSRDYNDVHNLCYPVYLAEPYQRKVEFYLEYDVNINKIINTFKNLDNEIDKMVQAPGTPAFDYSQIETKYIRFKISKRAGFWRYKVDVELDLQSQPQASHIKEIVIERGGYYGITKTEIHIIHNSIFLYITGSKLYCCENPVDSSYNFSHNLCYSTYLTKSYRNRIEFYLEYNININEVIDTFKNLDDEVNKMVQASGTPAFDYSQTETKYIRFKISKKAGFWRYKVEVELNLQFRVPYIREIDIKEISYRAIKTGVRERRNSIVLGIVGSKLYYCEDPTDDSYTNLYNLYSLTHSVESYQKKIEFYLEYDININEVIDAFKNLDDVIDKKIRLLNTSVSN